jgi:hypothetical protein
MNIHVFNLKISILSTTPLRGYLHPLLSLPCILFLAISCLGLKNKAKQKNTLLRSMNNIRPAIPEALCIHNPQKTQKNKIRKKAQYVKITKPLEVF